MILNFLLYILTGAFAGLLAGLLGVGGGSIVVPSLALIFAHANMPYSVIMHIAAGTSLAAMIFTTTVAVFAQHRNQMILWPLFRQLLPGIVIGVIAGAYAASLLSTHWLQLLFGLFLTLMALRMLIPRIKNTLPSLPGKWGQTGAGLAIGGMSGLLGIGGGALSVPLLLRYGIPAHNATATSSACALLLALVGTLSFMFTGAHISNLPVGCMGYVYWPAAIAIAVSSIFFVTAGAKLARHLSGLALQRVFAIFLLLVGVEMLVK